MRRRQLLPLLFGLGVALVGATTALADAAPTTQATLERLNQQTKTLYHQVQSGIYRVEMPQPKWVNAYAMAAIERWEKKLSPDVRERLAAQTPVRADASEVGPVPSTRPSDVPTILPGQGTFIVVRPQAGNDAERDPIFGGKLQMDAKPRAGFAPNNIGLLLDDDGHVLVPLYVERETVGGRPVRLAGADGMPVDARFVGSDRQTNLTLLQVEKPRGKPVKLGSARPDSGSLVLCLAVGDGSGRLGLWTDGAEDNGIIVNTGGEVVGIARYGQFLSGSACKLIARQLIEFGAVKRATLGVLITEIQIRQDDPLRRQHPILGSRSAMRIDQVIAGSAADRAGLKSGDLVLSVAGEPVNDLPSFAAAIAARNGDTELLILRADKTLKLTVDLQQQK